MPRVLIRNMSAEELMAHWEKLNQSRITKARKDIELTARASAAVRKAAEERLIRAQRMAAPRRAWQINAAIDKAKAHGIRAGASFLRVNGWSLDAALFALLSK